MGNRLRPAAVALVAVLAASCGPDPSCPCYPFGGATASAATTPSSPTSTTPTFTTYTDADLQFCVDTTNAHRATLNLPALIRSSILESYAQVGAAQDGAAHVAHQHFSQTAGGGVASAENEIPWYGTSGYASVQLVIEFGVNQMWAEGPTGAHYQTIAGPYTQMGCGIYIANGEITVTQDFR